MYKDKEAQREANRLAAKKRRDKAKGMTEGMTFYPLASYPDKENVIPDTIKQYPAIITALVDPIKREKLERITAELKARRLLKSVRYGVFGPTFEQVAEMLSITAS
jgi:hypothetical protein